MLQKQFTDQIGNTLNIPNLPKRIVSLVPSLTELLYDLGLSSSVAGITRFCVHPENKPDNVDIVGGTKDVKEEVIHSIQPDLIIASKEENTKECIERLATCYPTFTTDIKDLYDALFFIQTIGEIAGQVNTAYSIAYSIKRSFDKLWINHRFSIAYFIWRKPYMSIGNDTFIHDMITRIGGVNVFGEETRYPVITEEMLATKNPDYIFLSSEPYPFKEKHIEEFKAICPNAKIILVDGEYFSWYGSRLIGSVDYFKSILNKF
jgi:ABC-type Fe3+-hydroxamate transport system substrate-binding protein